MDQYSSEVLKEGMELSWAVFSPGKRGFEGAYQGVVDNYAEIAQIRRGIDVDSLQDIHKFDFPESEEGSYDKEDWARVFLSVSYQPDTSEIAEGLELDEEDVGHIVQVLEENELLSFSDEGLKYGEVAQPYLELFEQAERVVEEYTESEGSGTDLDDNEQEEIGPEDVESNELDAVIEEVIGSKEDMNSTVNREDDGGIKNRDETF